MADATLSERAETPEPDDEPGPSSPLISDEDAAASIDAAYDLITLVKLHAAETTRLEKLYDIVHGFMPGWVAVDTNEPVDWSYFPFDTRVALTRMLCRCMEAMGEIADGSSLTKMYIGGPKS